MKLSNFEEALDFSKTWVYYKACKNYGGITHVSKATMDS